MATALTLIDAIAEWIGSQRWFIGGGMHPQLTLVSRVSLHSDAHTRVKVLVISDDGGARPVFYQVPVVLRHERRVESDLGFIGTVLDTDDTIWFAYDGPTDVAFTNQLLNLLVNGGEFTGDHAHVCAVKSVAVKSAAVKRVAVKSEAVTGVRPQFDHLKSSVLRGEQSNTSIVYSSEARRDSPDTPRVICKLFRMLHHGDNPDVVLQTALVDAGSESVPPIIGSIIGEWPDATQKSGRSRGHLAFAQEFLAGAEDGWTRALDAVANDTDFTQEARRIGAATADMHATLARVMPTRLADEANVADTIFSWQRRLDAAIAEVPELETLRSTIEALYARAEAAPWPRLQRIHGDLHLGQVLSTPDGAWTLIDFEGEPLRPLAERSLPDIPLRDLAGMLRSIDYAAGSHTATKGAVAWASACRRAFLDGYSERSQSDVRQDRALLDAFELDKALYEVAYEAHNRPAWMPIPIAAVGRLARRVENEATGAR